MSYLALARKWRPTQFKEVVGQAHVLTALENALAQNRLHHAYLFSGTRGVGKTSIARLLAKGLNCETGITATPCGECATCREIDQGRFVDLLEIDAASRTKVEDTRELLDNVQYKPARGRFKVYLIDEVHMLSRHSFNALLKTLEEPPEYVKFLLATTDPQKLPVTILSRCLQFHLKPISVDDIQHQLAHIMQQEQISSEAKALNMLAHAADGSMRDALSLTDQAIALGNGNIQADIVSHMLGTLDTDQALHLLQAISSQSPQIVLDSIQSLAEMGVEWDGLLQQLATQLHRVAMYQTLPATLDKELPDADKIMHLAQVLAPQDVQLYYQMALKGRQDLPLSPTGRVGIEMIVLRMMAFKPSQVAVAQSLTTQPAVSQPALANDVMPPQRNKAPASEPLRAQHSPMNTVANHAPDATPLSPSVPEAAPQNDLQVVPQQPSASTPEPTPSVSHSPVGGLRHQLRSQRKGLNQPKEGPGVKKAQAVSEKPVSVLERVAQRGHQNGHQMPHNAHANEATIEPEVVDESNYQWRPSQPQQQVQPKKELTPTQLKRALEHEKTPAMAERLIAEASQQDEWAALIQRLDTAKLVEQIALNSTFHKNGSLIELVLRPTHAHLNTDKAQSELLEAINAQLGEDCQLTVTIGESGETPLELRERLYQSKLSQAMESLACDPNVQFIERRFNAELDKDSVRPI
ncbi:DNA polymerase III subunit gamma/tau [Vibrio sp. CAIM 722]|uniref:DNA polymerase III subunit gamma/tau n=1 Tax=Vibrio eleionomae TaxID=2653505 RepID=A0A7X4LK61_9VIBR|nr:DNA polymerase III subunit gamma/tau [Vibrio eleionomae]MZI93463.1 DNA polymerase III subunit gamma/tau [Vibrio eleionomae]